MQRPRLASFALACSALLVPGASVGYARNPERIHDHSRHYAHPCQSNSFYPAPALHYAGVRETTFPFSSLRPERSWYFAEPTAPWNWSSGYARAAASHAPYFGYGIPGGSVNYAGPFAY